MRRAAVAAGVLMLVGSAPAQARPIGFQFSAQLYDGALAGTPVWGSFFWDDLGPGQSTAPIQSLTLNIGAQNYNLTHGVFPAYVQSPHLDPVYGFANDWGPRFQLRTNFLTGGLTNFSLFEGGNVFAFYSYAPNSPYQYFTQATTGIASVPEPGTLFLGLSGLATAFYTRKRIAKRSRRGTN